MFCIEVSHDEGVVRGGDGLKQFCSRSYSRGTVDTDDCHKMV